MKTVSGKIVSTKPVNLSKAANILSNFVNFDNGASQIVSAYLSRASEAFNELVFYKNHLKQKKNRPKEDASTRSDVSHRSVEEDKVRVPENFDKNLIFDENAGEVNENGTRKDEGKLRKKEKKKKDRSLGSGKNSHTEVDLEQGNENAKEKSEEKKKKKKRKNAEADGGEAFDSAAPKSKKRRTKADE